MSRQGASPQFRVFDAWNAEAVRPPAVIEIPPGTTHLRINILATVDDIPDDLPPETRCIHCDGQVLMIRSLGPGDYAEPLPPALPFLGLTASELGYTGFTGRGDPAP